MSFDNSSVISSASRKRKYRDFELTVEENLDVVGRGVVGFADAVLWFEAFFNGCVSLCSATWYVIKESRC